MSLISWLQSLSAVILEPPKIKSATVSTISPSICHKVMGPDAMISSICLKSIHDYGKTIALTRWTFVVTVMSLLFNMLSRFVLAFLPRSQRPLISWLQSPAAVILEPPPKKKSQPLFPHLFAMP